MFIVKYFYIHVSYYHYYTIKCLNYFKEVNRLLFHNNYHHVFLFQITDYLKNAKIN